MSGYKRFNKDTKRLTCNNHLRVQYIICSATIRAGTNLLGNFETPMQVTFDFAPVIENTRGELDTNTFSRSPN